MLNDKKPTLIETNVSPHASRVDDDGKVTILGTKKFMAIGALPVKTPSSVVDNLNLIFSCHLEWRQNILEVALQSNNGVLHPAAVVLNAGWVESKKGDFYFYKDGISPAVGKIIEKIDEERIEIGQRFGFKLRSLLDEMVNFYGGDYKTISDFAFNTTLHNIIKEAPTNMQHRYISEDVPFALVPWYEFGKLVGFEAKTMKSIIDLASTINGIDYMETGRSLEKLGLTKMGKENILNHINGVQKPQKINTLLQNQNNGKKTI